MSPELEKFRKAVHMYDCGAITIREIRAALVEYTKDAVWMSSGNDAVWDKVDELMNLR